MAANTAPVFGLTPRLDTVNIGTANTSRTTFATGSYFTVAGTNGTRVEGIAINALVTTTAGTVRIWVNDGSNDRLIDEVIVAAVTVGASTPGWSGYWKPKVTPFVLPSGWKMGVTTEKAESMNCQMIGSDL